MRGVFFRKQFPEGIISGVGDFGFSIFQHFSYSSFPCQCMWILSTMFSLYIVFKFFVAKYSFGDWSVISIIV